jgi:hypothetical protein
MKTMTCKQLGGPCDLPHYGNPADEVIKAQDKHLKDVVAQGDATHEGALKEMKGRWKHPISGMGWYRRPSVILRRFPTAERSVHSRARGRRRVAVPSRLVPGCASGKSWQTPRLHRQGCVLPAGKLSKARWAVACASLAPATVHLRQGSPACRARALALAYSVPRTSTWPNGLG